MSDGIKTLRRTQLGREGKNGGGKGTAVAATAIYRGQSTWKDDTETKEVVENVGLLMDTDRAYHPSVGASGKFGADPLTFEQFPYILAASIRGIEKGVKDGTGSGYIYTYPVPTALADIEYSASTISFVLTGKKLDDSGNGLAFVHAGDIIQVTGSVSNNGIFTVVSAAAGEIVVNETIANEGATPVVTIKVLIQSYTIEDGDNAQAWETKYSFCTDWEISGEGGDKSDAIMLNANWEGQQRSKSTFTPALSLPSIVEALFLKSKLYIDTTTMGSTQVTNTFLGFDLKYTSGQASVKTGDGNKYFSLVEYRRPVMSLDVTMIYNAITSAEIDLWLADPPTPRLLRIVNQGPALTTPGTTYTYKSLILNLPGYWTSFPDITDLQEGDIIKATFKPCYVVSKTTGPSIVVVNELVSLP